jgi:hypothetical protein
MTNNKKKKKSKVRQIRKIFWQIILNNKMLRTNSNLEMIKEEEINLIGEKIRKHKMIKTTIIKIKIRNVDLKNNKIIQKIKT